MIGFIEEKPIVIPSLDDYMELVYQENKKFNLDLKLIYTWIDKTTGGVYIYVDTMKGYYGIFGVHLQSLGYKQDLYTYFANYKKNAYLGLYWLKGILRYYKLNDAITKWNKGELIYGE